MKKRYLACLCRLSLTFASGSIFLHWISDSFGFDELNITLGLTQKGLRSLNLSHPEVHPAGALLSWAMFSLFPPPQYNARLIGAIPILIVSLFIIRQLTEAANQSWPGLGGALVPTSTRSQSSFPISQPLA